jgi:DNA polymerase-3 subunit epsilon
MRRSRRRNKETTILVVGDQDIRVLNGYAKSTKRRKAEKMIQAGAKLRIVGESDFRLLVAYAAPQSASEQ